MPLHSALKGGDYGALAGRLDAPPSCPVGRGGELHLPKKPSILAQYIREFRKDKGGPGRKHPKELGVAQVKVLSVNQIAQIEVYRGLCGETLT